MLGGILTRISPAAARFELWQGRLDLDDLRVAECALQLTDAERARAQRLHFAHDRRRFVVSRCMLRMLLAARLGLPAAEVSFALGKHGKPCLADPIGNIDFNVSHAAERVLYAISSEYQVGVDIEHVHREIDCDALAERFFTAAESASLRQVPEILRRRAFLACWTRKEAVVKATGDGMSLAFDRFEVTTQPDGPASVLKFHTSDYEPADWALFPVDTDPDYVATVATWRRRCAT